MSPHRRSTDTPAARKRRTKVLLWGALGALGFVLFAVTIVIQQHAIQQSREATIRRSCVDTNERHDNALRVLDERIAQAIRKDPARAAEIRESREFTVLLLNAIVPRTDCSKRAKRLTQ